MAIVFADDFNSYPPLSLGGGWSGGAWAVPGGTTSPGNLIACCEGVARHDFTTGATSQVSLRVQTAIRFPPATAVGASFMWVNCPGIDATCLFTYHLEIYPDGRFGFAMNNAASLVTSAPGLFPTDGTLFALQWRVQATGPKSCAFAVDVNNVTVWSSSLNWAAFVSAPCLSGAQFPATFTRVYLFPANSTTVGAEHDVVFDNLEIANTSGVSDWPVASAVYPAYCGMPKGPLIAGHRPGTVVLYPPGIVHEVTYAPVCVLSFPTGSDA